jgi:polyhydroxyalkanoate synthase subunit PhaC
MALSSARVEAHAPPPADAPLKLGLARLAHGISPASLALAYADWYSHLLVSPSRQADLAASALRKWLAWLQYAPHAWQGECAYGVEPRPQDKRFSTGEWQTPPFSTMAQAFLLQDQWWNEAMTGVRGVSTHHEDVAAFTTRQWLDMWSPSNFVATNPQVLKEALATGGANLASGFVNWSRDALAVLTDGKPRGVEEFFQEKPWR